MNVKLCLLNQEMCVNLLLCAIQPAGLPRISPSWALLSYNMHVMSMHMALLCSYSCLKRPYVAYIALLHMCKEAFVVEISVIIDWDWVWEV